MDKRPVGVSVVCWVLIVLSVLGLIGAIYMLASPSAFEKLEAQQGLSDSLIHYNLSISIISPIVNLILSILMLRAVNLARHIYLVFNAIVYIIALIFTPAKIMIIITIIIFLIFLYFLYNKPANEFFTMVQQPEKQP